MILVYLFLFLLFVGFVSFLTNKFKRDKKLKRKFYQFGDGNWLILTIFLLIFTYIGINLCMNDPAFQDNKKQIIYGEQTRQPWLVSQAYTTISRKDTANIDAFFYALKMHFDKYQELGPSVKKFNAEGSFLFGYYQWLIDKKDDRHADLGNLFLGIYYFMTDDMSNAGEHLDAVHNKKLKYLNNYLAMVRYWEHKPAEAKKMLQEEIKLNGYREGAYHNLSRIYEHEKNYTELNSLVNSPSSKAFVPYSFRKLIYIRNTDIKSYFSDLFSEIFRNTNLIGFLGALFILLIWVMYLHRINIHSSGNWISSLGVVLLSAVLVLPVWLLYDFYKYALSFELNGKFGNDFLYCVFGIGVIEELVKIIPFLLILWFTKAIKEPIDYIMYASLSALGFAFVENFQYFENGSLNIMHSRALTASISHMIDSSIIAYGLILAKFKYKKNSVLFFSLFFLIAAFSHGFYDFWLLNEDASSYSIVTFLCLLTSILAYASFINNALNNPSSLSQNIQLNTAKLSSDLAASLLAIFLFEYICLSFIYGPTIGNRELITSVLGGGYLILFLSIRLSNIDVFPGEWDKIDFFVGLLPMQIIYGDKKPNYNTALGLPLRIRLFRKKSKLADILPVEGEIIKREKISGFTGWFLIKLNKPLPYLKVNNEYILIRAKSQIELIGKEEESIIYFMTIPDMSALDKPNKKFEDFRFVDWAIAG